MQSSGTATITFCELSVPTCELSYSSQIPLDILLFINLEIPSKVYHFISTSLGLTPFLAQRQSPFWWVCLRGIWVLWNRQLLVDCVGSFGNIQTADMNLLNVLRPFGKIFPTVPKSPIPLNLEQRTMFTAIALFIYIVCSQIPLYGIERSHEADPLYWARVIMASSRGTLMEFGISPIISAGWILQIITAMGILKVNSKKDEKDAEGLENVLALIFCFGEVAGAIWYGAYGQPSQMSVVTMGLIVGQLMGAGCIVILLDDMLKKGYGLGSGISLFIVANTSEVLFWFAFSPVTMSSQFGVQFQGAFIALVHFLFTKDTIWQAIVQAFTRQNGFNLGQLSGSFFIFLVLIYLQRFSAKVEVISQKFTGYSQRIPIKLFFTSNMSVILQSMLISNFYRISQILHDRYHKSLLIKLIGTWQGDRIVGGILWYVSPPSGIVEAITYPHRTICYTVFVCFLCAVLAKFWIVIGRTTPKDYAKMVRGQQLTLRNYKQKSVIRTFEELIPIASMLGGVIIGFMTVLGDLLNVAGSSTGIMLSISILYGYYEKMSPKEEVIEDF